MNAQHELAIRVFVEYYYLGGSGLIPAQQRHTKYTLCTVREMIGKGGVKRHANVIDGSISVGSWDGDVLRSNLFESKNRVLTLLPFLSPVIDSGGRVLASVCDDVRGINGDGGGRGINSGPKGMSYERKHYMVLWCWWR